MQNVHLFIYIYLAFLKNVEGQLFGQNKEGLILVSVISSQPPNDLFSTYKRDDLTGWLFGIFNNEIIEKISLWELMLSPPLEIWKLKLSIFPISYKQIINLVAGIL